MLLAVLGTMEIVIIVAVVLLIFGPSKLPQLGQGVGKMLRGFKKEMKGMEEDNAGDAGKSKAIEGDDDEEIDVTPKKKSAES